MAPLVVRVRAPVLPSSSWEAAVPPRTPYGLFVDELIDVSPGNLRALWLPKDGDHLTTISPIPGGRLWTYSATANGRKTASGHGLLITFNGTTEQITTPQTADVVFGNGTVDSPFSVVALANVTNTAAVREIIGITDSLDGPFHYRFAITATDALSLQLLTASGLATVSRDSDAAATQGSVRLFGASYSGVGGASAADGITLYEDGAVKASTATNNALYVAMQSFEADFNMRVSDATQGPFSGSVGFVALYAGLLTLAQHAAVKAASNRYHG